MAAQITSNLSTLVYREAAAASVNRASWPCRFWLNLTPPAPPTALAATTTALAAATTALAAATTAATTAAATAVTTAAAAAAGHSGSPWPGPCIEVHVVPGESECTPRLCIFCPSSLFTVFC